MHIRLEDEQESAALNLAPMIDVVFLLLIFFMVATTFVDEEKELGLELPVAESGDEPEHAPDEIVINLLADGRIVVGGEDVTMDGLRALLERAARRSAATPVTIRGDKQAVLERLVGVMDVCRVAGLEDLGVMTLDG